MKKDSTSLEAWLPHFEAAFFSSLATDEAFASQPEEMGTPSVIAVIKSQGNPHEQSLADALEEYAEVAHVQLCEEIQDINQLLVSYPSSILFADIHTLQRISPGVLAEHHCVVLGQSNHDALDAFGLKACGFVQLPVEEGNLDNCMAQVIEHVKQQVFRDQYQRVCKGLSEHLGVTQDALGAMLRQRCASQKRPAVLGLRSGDGWCCLQARDIRWIEAAGDYMCVYTLSENHIVRSTLTELIKRLDSDDFVRVNRSIVVNRQHVESIVCHAPHVHYLVMNDGSQLKISRRYYTSYWQKR